MMKSIVITGSTRGIGYAMAKAFLERDCRVVINGRNKESTRGALETLSEQYPSDQLAGAAADVSNYDSVRHLWDESLAAFGKIDIWINNAGISHEQAPPWLVPVNELQSIIQTNILGELYGTRVAMQGFLDQGFGALYNVEGMGADGKTHGVKGLSVYGMTKAGLHYFNHCLAGEVDHPHIITGALQPGMVLTDMILERYKDRPEDWESDRKILSMIASPVEDVAAWMADKILKNVKNGVYFKYSNTWRMLRRMARSFFRKKTSGKKINQK
ncbi:MAG: SDR family oxidoreductase [Brevefilum sp.]|nr:SDR family oxidoreductase [Brevefilum sp.]